MSETSSAAFAERASALIDLGRAKDAERELRTALASDPDAAHLHIDLARALLLQERNDEAIEAATAAVRLAPEHPYALYILSVAQAADDNLTAAWSSIDAALRVAPEIGPFHRHRGYLLHQQNDAAEALKSFERARALDPEDPDTMAAIGGVLFDLRRDREATAAVNEALALDPNNAAAHHVRSLIAMRSGSSRDAVDSGRAAVRLDPTNADRRELLAVTMKARNPLYRAMWRFHDWLGRMPPNYKWIALFAPLVLVRVLRTAGDSLWAQILIGIVIGFVALSWLIEPLMNAVLLASSYGRGLLPAATKRATWAFIGFATAAAGCAIAGLATDTDDLLIVALACTMWAASSGMIHSLAQERQRLGWCLSAVAAAVAIVVIAATVAGAAFAWPFALLLLLGGIASMWFVSLSASKH